VLTHRVGVDVVRRKVSDVLRVILTVLEKFMGLHHLSPPQEELREEEDAGHQ